MTAAWTTTKPEQPAELCGRHPAKGVGFFFCRGRASYFETLHLLDEQNCIVGIPGYVVRPPEVRREKPRARPSPRANIDEILALKSDLVLNLDGQE
jgi:hypothetical protein